jgi:hypothetical protein
VKPEDFRGGESAAHPDVKFGQAEPLEKQDVVELEHGLAVFEGAHEKVKFLPAKTQCSEVIEVLPQPSHLDAFRQSNVPVPIVGSTELRE